ncbi:MAG: transposase [Desulfobacteraceae bacterium]|nr:transposase [Desulfobacteraceae bacterium]
MAWRHYAERFSNQILFQAVCSCFLNRRRTAIKILCYDGQGFWMCQKRLSQGRFKWWPEKGQGPDTPPGCS